ncbi:hypothetical protein D030_4515B, partial [Vibrio parahaemolyticus AQ3810]
WNWIAGKLQRDKDCRNSVSQNEYAILSNLRVSDAFHATKNGVHEYDTHTNQ